jgi:hypothetical protein
VAGSFRDGSSAELGYALEIDGPSDEELEQLKRDDEPGDDEVPF